MFGEAMSALERSVCYRGFAEAFRSPGGGADIFDETLIPLPSKDASAEFLGAFDPSVSKSGCSLYESAHSEREQMALYEELVRWYDHFGLQRKTRAELPDHISIELEFMHFLAYREHVMESHRDSVETLRSAQRAFLEKHLFPLTKAIKQNMRKTAAQRYKAIAEAAHDFVDWQIVYLNGA